MVIEITNRNMWREMMRSEKYRDAGLYEIGRRTIWSFWTNGPGKGTRILKVLK